MVKKQVGTDDRDLEHLTEIWSLLTPEEKDYLRSNYLVQQFKKNEILHCEGDKSHSHDVPHPGQDQDL